MSASPWGSNDWGEQAWGDNGIDVTFSASYGIGAWGEFAWGEGNLTTALSTQTGSVVASISIDANVTGISLTGFVGDTTETGTANVSITGIPLTTAIGEEIPEGNAIVSVTGTSLISTVDPVSITADGNVSDNVIGIALTSAVGIMTADAGALVDAVGQQLTTSIGNAVLDANTIVYPTNLAPTFPFTAYGNAALSTSQAKFGVSSLYVTNISGSAVQSDNAYNLGSYTDYTLEFWFYPQDISGFYTLFDGRNTFLNNAPAITQNGNDVNFVYGTFVGIFASNVLTSANQWYHVAVTKNGSTYEMYVDGVSAGTYTNAGSLSAKLTIGSYNTRNSLNFNGYIDEFRLSTVRRYTANFTPPTSAFVEDSDTEFLLHLDGANGSTTIESGDDTFFGATSAIGEVAVGISQEVLVTGSQLSTFIGEEIPTGNANVSVTGINLTGSLGNIVPESKYAVTGSALTTSVGSVITQANADVSVTGQALTTAIGNTIVTAWQEIDPNVNQSFTEVSPGTNQTWTEVDKAA